MTISLRESRTRGKASYPAVYLTYRKYTRGAIRATPARTAITMPAIAPPEKPEELPCVESSVMERTEKNE